MNPTPSQRLTSVPLLDDAGRCGWSRGPSEGLSHRVTRTDCPGRPLYRLPTQTGVTVTRAKDAYVPW